MTDQEKDIVVRIAVALAMLRGKTKGTMDGIWDDIFDADAWILGNKTMAYAGDRMATGRMIAETLEQEAKRRA